MNGLVWDSTLNTSGTSRLDWLDEKNTQKAIDALEVVSDIRGYWDENDFGGLDWSGLSGTFNGEIFTVYTHKSGTIKIGGFDGLDVAGLKAALSGGDQVTAERTLELIDRILYKRLVEKINDEDALNQISELVVAWTDPKSEPATVIHTTCRYCEQDIEGIEPFDDWRDRGNNTRCPNDARRKHRPV